MKKSEREENGKIENWGILMATPTRHFPTSTEGKAMKEQIERLRKLGEHAIELADELELTQGEAPPRPAWLPGDYELCETKPGCDVCFTDWCGIVGFLKSGIIRTYPSPDADYAYYDSKEFEDITQAYRDWYAAGRPTL